MNTENLHLLLAATRLHILQSYSLQDTVTCCPETYAFFKKTHKAEAIAKKEEPTQNLSPLYKAPTQPIALKPKVQEKEKQIEIVEEKKEQDRARLPPSPFLLALCQKPKKVTPSVLSDIEKHVPNIKKEEVPNFGRPYPWEKSYPECLVVSFFSKESSEEAFLHKMAQAITARRTMRIQIAAASSDSQAYTHTVATTGILRAVFIASDKSQAEKVHKWRSTMPGMQPNKENASLLTSQYLLFDTPVYELLFTHEPTTQEKKALWNVLLNM
jgi:hypothetical protein